MIWSVSRRPFALAILPLKILRAELGEDIILKGVGDSGIDGCVLSVRANKLIDAGESSLRLGCPLPRTNELSAELGNLMLRHCATVAGIVDVILSFEFNHRSLGVGRLITQF